MSSPLLKYPRTRHIEGSRLQTGDHDLSSVRFADVRGQQFVVEEKMDGANSGISFDAQGKLQLQCRGHYLNGGPRERHFSMFKQWASVHQDGLRHVLGTRYIMYGEWLYAKHTCFYDQLPHYFMEFDILDRERGVFLGTPERHAMLAGLPIVSVAVLWQGRPTRLKQITSLVTPSLFKSENWRESLARAAGVAGVAPEVAAHQSDREDVMEGLYIKIEANGEVVDRLKWVRASFLSAIQDAGDHWLDRPIIENQLTDGVDLWAPTALPTIVR